MWIEVNNHHIWLPRRQVSGFQKFSSRTLVTQVYVWNGDDYNNQVSLYEFHFGHFTYEVGQMVVRYYLFKAGRAI